MLNFQLFLTDWLSNVNVIAIKHDELKSSFGVSCRELVAGENKLRCQNEDGQGVVQATCSL